MTTTCFYCGDITTNKVFYNENREFCSEDCIYWQQDKDNEEKAIKEEIEFIQLANKHCDLVTQIKAYSPKIINEEVTDEEAENEEYWLYTCRKARCYNGPVGGPPGLRNGELNDPYKAVKFRRLCSYFSSECPQLTNKKEKIESVLIEDDLIYSLAKDYLDNEEFAIKFIITKQEEKIQLLTEIIWSRFNKLKQLRIEGVAKGLSNIQIRDIINKEKEDINWLKIM